MARHAGKTAAAMSLVLCILCCGPFRARVQLGMKAELDRFLMHNPDGSGAISSVAVGPGGSLYVFHRDGTANGNQGGHKIKVYDRNGKHLKALTPFPADIDPKKVKALGTFQTTEGDLVPHIHNWETLSFYPDAFGVRDESLARTISKKEFPPGVKVGGQLEGTTDDGRPQVFHVMKIKGDQVLLDGNHPLAGKTTALATR